MFTADVEFPTVLKGVSTQRWDLRQPGGLDESINMINDPVTGLRRRPGFSLKRQVYASAGIAAAGEYYSWFQELNGYSVHIVVECTTGRVSVYDTDWNELAVATSTYLQGSTRANLCHTSLAGTAWIANRATKPVALYAETRLNPDQCGYFQCNLGEWEKKYNITVAVTTLVSGTESTESHTVEYTAPASSGAGATGALPGTIAKALSDAAIAAFTGDVKLTSAVSEYVVFLKATSTAGTVTKVRVTTSNTNSYLLVSDAMVVALATNLPNKLPDDADGAVVAQGADESGYVYYQYYASERLWKEARTYGYCSGIQYAPARLALTKDSTTLQFTLTVDTADWPGASAGNATSNKLPPWVTYGISGLCSAQGRLGIMAEDTVTFSESDYPTRHFRSTIGSLPSTDRISVSGGSAASATFYNAVPLNKDLLVFSSTHLGVIPVGTSVLSPSNTALLTNCRISAKTLPPVETGQSIQFVSNTLPRTVYEVYPDTNLTSVYTVSPATDHIRGYVPDTLQYSVGMPGIGCSVFGGSTTLLVNEYVWSAGERPLNAWHTWTTPGNLPLAGMHGTHDTLVLLLTTTASDGTPCMLVAELRIRGEAPLLDLWVLNSPAEGNTGAHRYTTGTRYAIHSQYGVVLLTRKAGTDLYYLPDSAPSGVPWYSGLNYTSTVQFPPYIPRTQQGAAQYRDATLVQAEFEVSGTGEFSADVPGYAGLLLSGASWVDDKFDQYRTASDYIRIPVPVRERMPLAYVRLNTTLPYELNILRVLYRTRLNNKFRRL